jgi:hypothetical protein
MHVDDEVRRCHEEIRRLKAENHELRLASESFGHLAERLNQALRAERRLRGADRRPSPRRIPDRRLVAG